MSDYKKPARPSGSRTSGSDERRVGERRPGENRGGENRVDSRRPAGKVPGKPTGKPGGKPGGKTGGKPGGAGAGKGPRRDGPPAWSTSKDGGGARGPKRDDRAPRPAGRDDRSPRPASSGDRPRDGYARKRDDDFDFSDAPRPAFPKPARPAKSGQRPDSRPARPARPEREDFADQHNRERRPSFKDEAARAPREQNADQGRALEEDGKSVTAGRNAVRELLEAAPKRIDGIFVRKGQRDAKVQEIVALADENRIKVQFVDDVFLRRLFAGTHQGVVAVTAAVEYAELDVLIASVADAPLPVLLALDQVQDPGNLGAIARTAWALGAAGIIVPRHGGAYIGGGAMRASAGALHHLPVARVTNMSQALDACAKAGLNILCAQSEGEDLNKAVIHMPAVLVMGGEEKGVRHGVGKHCDQRLAIPLRRTFDSLNVAQAAAICLARLGQL